MILDNYIFRYRTYLGDLILWCLATEDRVPLPKAGTMPGGFGAKFGFPWLMTGFVDDWEWGFGDELGANELLPILKDGDCGDVCGCGVDEKSVDLFGKIDMPVLLGITNCGEALPFNGVGDEEADALVALLWQQQNIITINQYY